MVKPSLPGLIVNADDFGYTPGINRAIVELHRCGALSSTTLMARGRALTDALDRLDSAAAATSPNRPATGCHVVLVDGAPSAPAEIIPSLLPTYPGSNPSFHPTLGAFVADLVRGRIREAEIETEAVAQIRSLQARGVRLTHLDTHKHTHIFPRVLRPLVRAALQCGIKAIRNPFEPAWSREATLGAPRVRRMQVALLRRLRPAFLRIVDEAGLATTAGALGVLATGTLDAATLERILNAVPRAPGGSKETPDQQIWELVCHPGYNDEALRAQATRLTQAREVERVALSSAGPLLERFGLMDFGMLG